MSTATNTDSECWETVKMGFAGSRTYLILCSFKQDVRTVHTHREPLVSRVRTPLSSKACNALGIRLTALAIASLLARGAVAQPPSKPLATTPVGTWRGTSLCLVRPSSCHDEVVVYRIARTKAVDSLTLDARKIVGGEEQEMGVLACRVTAPDELVTCVIPHGIWQFRARNDSLVGELRLTDNTKFRDVRAVRAR